MYWLESIEDMLINVNLMCRFKWYFVGGELEVELVIFVNLSLCFINILRRSIFGDVVVMCSILVSGYMVESKC